MTCHAVLWIPTIVYQGFAEPKQSSIEKDISDIPGKGNFVRVSLSDNGDVQVSIGSGRGGYIPLVTLIREDVSSNGLISFTYKSTTDKECGFRFTTKEFPTAKMIHPLHLLWRLIGLISSQMIMKRYNIT